MTTPWSQEAILELVRGFQPACIVTAAADLNLFTLLREKPMDVQALGQRLEADERALRIVLDALCALNFVKKTDGVYSTPDTIASLLTENAPNSILPGVRHLANTLRRWNQLAQVVKSGKPAERIPSIRGVPADSDSFIGAMQVFTRPIVEPTLQRLQPLHFKHLLDIGGASGNWTVAFLKMAPEARATLFDLPEVINLAQEHLSQENVLNRVNLIPGDYNIDPLPTGVDLVWLSAITHQNPRAQNRNLYAKIYKSLEPNGNLIIRDYIMASDKTTPAAGALFAVNMLTATEGGDTFTLDVYQEDIAAAGFSRVEVIFRDETMNSLLRVQK